MNKAEKIAALKSFIRESNIYLGDKKISRNIWASNNMVWGR